MSLADDLSPASYKGVGFYVNSSRLTGGPKDVKHQYPNKDTQVIENLGKMPRVYYLEIVITGDNYLQDRDNLIRVLEEGGPGTLVHPFYGRIENIVARPYTLNEDMTGLGEGRITVTFEPTLDTGIPTASQNTLNNVSAKNTAFQDSVKSDISGGFTVTSSFTGNFSSAVADVNSAVEAFSDNTKVLQAAADEIDSFTNQVSELSANVFSLVQAPVSLADSIGNMFITIDNLYPSVKATVDVLTGFFDHGDNGNGYPLTTAGRIERANNTAIMNAAMQGMSLGFAYLNTVQIDFQTTIEIDAAADTLEDQYQKIINADGLSDTTKDLLTDLRLAAQSYFEEQKLTAQQVIEVHTGLTSVRLLSYQYYGTSEFGETLAQLNDAQDVAFIEGTVKVLTA